MINGKYHVSIKWHGDDVLVDAAEINGKYEVMVLDRHGNDYECEVVDTLGEAEESFMRMVRKYSGEPSVLKGRYAKLRDDLKRALASGAEEEKAYKYDLGTCNFDATGVCLRNWKHDLVRQAAKEAGTTAYTWELGAGWWVFNPITHSQGSARTRNAETVTALMGGSGYRVCGYYETD